MLQIALGRITQIVLSILTMRVATTVLPPAEMARIFLIYTAVAFYALLLLNPVGMFMNRRLHAWNANGRVAHYYNYFWLYLLIVALIAAASTGIIAKFNLLAFHTSFGWLLFLIFSSMLITTANQVVIPGLNLLGNRTWFVYLTLATTVASLVIAICMVMIVKPIAEYWLVGLLAGQLLIAFVGARIFYSKISPITIIGEVAPRITYFHIRKMWGFSWPILIGAGLVWVQTQSYRFFMDSSLGLAKVGLFVAGYAISSSVISSLESVFTTYLQPIFYKHVSRGSVIEQGNAWTNYAGTILPSLLLVGFFVAASAPELTRLLLSSAYRDSSQFVVWGAIAESARVATGVYGMVAHARMNTKLLILPSVAGAVISIGLLLLLMPRFGAVAVGFALAVANISVFLATVLATRKELATTLPNRTLIQCFVVGIGLLAVAAISRNIMGVEGIGVALMLLSLLAIIFLPTQYWILRSALHEQDKTNE